MKQGLTAEQKSKLLKMAYFYGGCAVIGIIFIPGMAKIIPVLSLITVFFKTTAALNPFNNGSYNIFEDSHLDSIDYSRDDILINPANGLPLIEGGCVDILGNPIGSDLVE